MTMMGTKEMTRGVGVTLATTRGTGVTREVARVRRGVTRGVESSGTRGVTMGLPGARMRPGNPHQASPTGLIGLTLHQVIRCLPTK